MTTPRHSRLFARLSAGIFGALLIFPVTGADQPKPQPTPARSLGPVVRSVDVTVTNLDVIVTDSKGVHVTGLKKEDFEVVEDGLQQAVTNFYAVDGGRVTFVNDEPVPPPAALVAGAPAEPAPAPIPTPKTRIVIFIDNLHLTPFNRNRILKNLEVWVKDAVKGDVEAMIVTWDHSLKIRKKFTNDGRDLVDVLRQLEEQSALGVNTVSERRDLLQAIDDAQSSDQAVGKARSFALAQKNDLEFTIDAMKTTMNQLSGLDGRKLLLHVSEGLPQSPGAELWVYIQERFRTSGTVSSNQFEFDKTAGFIGIVQAANAAGVTIYAFDASGLSVDSSITAENRTNKQRIDTFLERGNLQSMLSLMSEETGGKAILNKNDIALSLKEVENDYTSYYSLGYRSLRSGSDRPHKVDVKLKKKGLTVRARRSYLEKSPETRVAEAVNSALFFSRDDNPLGVALEVGQPVPADRQNYVVPIRIRVPYSRITMLPEGPKVRGRLVFYFVVLDSQGKQSDLAQQAAAVELDATAFGKMTKADFQYDVKLLMIPGGQKLSLAVRDDVTHATSYIQKSIFVSALPPSEKPVPAPK
ncbi:MAG: VWA domain-containing protein [Thermoanaerobaculia bacterium]